MGQVLPLTPTVRAMVKRADDAPKLWQAEAAADRMGTLRPLLLALSEGVPEATALRDWAAASGKSVQTGRNWLRAYQTGGAQALAPKWCRPQHLDGMEAVVLRLYNQPSRPNCGTLSRWIEDQTGVKLSAGRIRRYLRSLPAIAAEQSPKRLGPHTYDMKVRPYVERDASVFKFGEAMHADGHCMKVWCLHPVSGKPFRAEFTPILDIRSNYLFDYWFAEAESANGTILALCRMVYHYQHAPALFYTDPGPGFNNKRVQALLAKLGVTHMISRAGNSRGRGFGEGFFRLFIEREAKKYAACCSRDRSDDTLARFETKWKRGEIYVPTFAEVQAHLAEFQERYNRTPQPYSRRLNGAAPADIREREGWQPCGITVPAWELLRPTKILTVRGGALRTLGRRFVHPDLLAHERRKVEVAFDLCDLSRVYVCMEDGRFVCEAPCMEARPYVSATYLEEVRAKSDAQKLKLLQKHADEVRARSAQVVSSAHIMDQLEGPATPALPQPETTLLETGHHITPPPARAPRKSRAVSPAALEHLRAEVEADAEPVDGATTTHDRIRRALALEARIAADETLNDDDARWLRIYQDSREYHSRRDLMDDFGFNQPEN